MAKNTCENDKFVCPGCGKQATSKDADFCRKCGAFVHKGCQKVEFVIGFRCPICGKHLRDF